MVWYCNVFLGKNILENLFGCMSKKVGLFIYFILYCIWVILVIIFKVVGLENLRVRSVIGYKSDVLIELYNERLII